MQDKRNERNDNPNRKASTQPPGGGQGHQGGQPAGGQHAGQQGSQQGNPGTQKGNDTRPGK